MIENYIRVSDTYEWDENLLWWRHANLRCLLPRHCVRRRLLRCCAEQVRHSSACAFHSVAFRPPDSPGKLPTPMTSRQARNLEHCPSSERSYFWRSWWRNQIWSCWENVLVCFRRATPTRVYKKAHKLIKYSRTALMTSLRTRLSRGSDLLLERVLKWADSMRASLVS